jgi:hypothetical protein
VTADLAVAVLVAATWLHLGFQTTVTLIVYPALARVPDEGWVDAHARHSRGIAPLVGVVYGALVVASAAVLATSPTAAEVVAVVASAAAVLVTAVRAAPLHGRLGRRDEALVRQLLTADRVRLLAATVAALAAAMAAAVRWPS